MKEKKLLIISTQVAGGCFQYSNEIIARWPGKKELVMAARTAEPHTLTPDWSVKYWGYPAFLRALSLACSVAKILTGIIRGKYSGILLFGTTKWERIILKAWKTSRLPSYIVIHDGVMHTGEKNDKQQKLILQLMKMSSHLIFLSQYVKEEVKEKFGIDKPSIIAPHGLIDYGPLPVVKKTEKPMLLFFGRIARYKGVELLLEAIKKVPSELYDKLIIAGEWLYRNNTDCDTDKILIIDRILSPEEIKRCLAFSDIIIFPYIEASQSGVATLAINYLIPSIATDVGAFREQLNDNTTVFVHPDAAELAAAITGLLKTPERLESMKEALKRLRAEYSWERIAENLANEISKSIREKTGKGQ